MMLKFTLALFFVLAIGTWGCKSKQPQVVPSSSLVNNTVAEQKKPQPATTVVPQTTPALSPSPEKSAAGSDQGWSVYESKQGGFKISHPKAVLLDTPEPGKTEFSFVQPFATGRDVLTFDVIVTDNPQGASAKDWALRQWGDGDAIKSEETTQLAGGDAYRLKTSEGDAYGCHIYTASGMKIYELSYEDPQTLMELSPEVRQQLADTFRRMVESFTLINQP